MTSSRLLTRPSMAVLLGIALAALSEGVVAQERYLYNLRQPRGAVGPATKLRTNCEPNEAERSVTCDTYIENSPSDTPAKLQYQPFEN
jgi:hypothetical protein